MYIVNGKQCQSLDPIPIGFRCSQLSERTLRCECLKSFFICDLAKTRVGRYKGELSTGKRKHEGLRRCKEAGQDEQRLPGN